MRSLPSKLLLLTTFVALTACGGSSWDRAVSKANKAEKVLIVEFYADWCGPCKRFEKNVLSDAGVKDALKRVEFRRFDYDSTAGKRFAHRMGIHAIPAVVAVNREGKGFRQLKGAVPKEEFLGFLKWSAAQVYPPSS